jgi:hypothetical protein
MDKITVVKDINGIEQVIIDKGNDEYTSMTKETYDAQQTASKK